MSSYERLALVCRGGFIESEGDHFIRLSDKFIEVIHPGDGTAARSRQTVGFHADPSDIEIAFEFLHLAHDIELLASAFLEKHSLAQHEHAHFIAFFNSHIGQPHGIVDSFSVIRRDNEQDLHSMLLRKGPHKALDFVPDPAVMSHNLFFA